MTPKKQCLKKIKEIIPEILDLKFGCRVKYRMIEDVGIYNKIGKFLYKEKIFYENFIKYWVLIKDISGHNMRCIKKIGINDLSIGESGIEIIGRPITLQDILRAISIKNRELFNCTDIDNGPDESGVLMQRDLVYLIFVYYDLTKDAENQSDEFYSFLWEILK